MASYSDNLNAISFLSPEDSRQCWFSEQNTAVDKQQVKNKQTRRNRNQTQNNYVVKQRLGGAWSGQIRHLTVNGSHTTDGQSVSTRSLTTLASMPNKIVNKYLANFILRLIRTELAILLQETMLVKQRQRRC